MDANAFVHLKKNKPKWQSVKFILIFGVVLLSAIFLVLAYRFSLFSSAKRETLRYQATKAHDHGHYDKAIQIYKKVLKMSPDDADINYNLGVAYISDNQIKEAQEQMQKLTELGNEEYAGILKNLMEKGSEKSKDRSRFDRPRL